MPPTAKPLPGVPFTIEHFKAWAARLELKAGLRFVLEPWQERFVADVFAGFKECWLIVPEGNGKSTLIAVLVVYCCEFAEDANIPVAASARDQAEIIFAQGSGFVRRSAALQGRFECKPGLREIVFGGSSRAKIYASDAGVGDGVIPYPLEVLDELHRHLTLDLYRTWAGKLDKEDAQLVVISTAGAPGSEFEQVREQMRQSAVEVERDGCFGRYVGPASVLHEYAVPEGGDVDDLALVKAANPSSRITVETLAAKRSRPSWHLGHWRRLTCNLPTRADFAAIQELEWFRQSLAELDPAGLADLAVEMPEIPAGERIWAGLDLGWKWDTTALVPLWWRDRDFRLLGPAEIIVPPRDGSSTDPALVEAALISLHARNPIETVVMDTHAGEQLASWIRAEIGAEVVDRSQSLPQAAMDYSRFMEALRERWLWHCGDAGLTRHALNAVARVLPRGDAVFERPVRSRNSRDMHDLRVIDALDAAAMVHSVLVAELAAEKPVYRVAGFG